MKYLLLLLAFLGVEKFLQAQYVYTIKADSVKITNCDSSELIIENHTQGVPGFLFNKGKGRTEFRHGLININDSLYLLGADTLNLNNALKSLSANNGVMRTGNIFQFGNDMSDPYGGPASQIQPIFYNQNSNIFNWMTGYYSILNFSKFSAPTTETNVLTPFYLARFSPSAPYSQVGMLMESNLQNYWEAPLNWISFKNNIDQAPKFSFYGDSLVAQIATITRQGSDGKAYAALYFQVASDTSYGNINNNGSVLKLFPSMTADGLVPIKIPTAGVKRLYISDTNDPWVNPDLNSTQNNPYSRLVVDAKNNPVVFANLPVTLRDTVNNKPLVINPTTGAIQYSSWSGGSGASADIIRSSLAVNGTITAQKLKLSATGWPDYVFDSAYWLPALPQVENYIRGNNHLPGIPSAAEVEKNGLDVGKNEAALLQKVEELTLYAIEQNKEIQSLKQEMENLKKLVLKKNN
jgi:hypothetical protein